RAQDCSALSVSDPVASAPSDSVSPRVVIERPLDPEVDEPDPIERLRRAAWSWLAPKRSSDPEKPSVAADIIEADPLESSPPVPADIAEAPSVAEPAAPATRTDTV